MTTRGLLLSAALTLLAPFALLAGATEEASDSGTKMAVPAGKYKEAPMLAALVAAGELPPVDERLPLEPYVAPAVEEVGTYGGTLNVVSIDKNPWNDVTESPENAGARFLEMTEDGSVVPDLARDYELAADGKSFTVYMREGAKWSDGHPLTADDVIFAFEDMHWNDQVETWNLFPGVSRVVKLDDYTVRFEMDEPYFAMELIMVQWPGGEWVAFHPKHYLEKWHINHNEDADKVAAEEGFDTWSEAFRYHFWWAPLNDLDKPTVMPWRITDLTNTVKAFERNPWFYQVDEAGQQLPYIDRVVSTIVDAELYHLKIIAGEADIASMFTEFKNWTLYKQNEEAGDYAVYPAEGITASQTAFEINQNHEDPGLRQVLNDIRFRQALSIALNRDEINKVIYHGLGVSFQATAMPTASFYKEEWGRAFNQYDPDEANRLLDEVGLTERDSRGFRLRPDGEPMFLAVEATSRVLLELELVKEYWEDVGLEVGIKEVPTGLFSERGQALDHIITVHPFETTTEVASYNWSRAGPGRWCPAWNQWLNANEDIRKGTKSLADYADGMLPGEEPPQHVKELYEWGISKPRTRFLSPEYTELSQKIYDLWAEKLYIIGTVGMVPQPVIAKKNLGNVVKQYPLSAEWAGGLHNEVQQLFWKS